MSTVAPARAAMSTRIAQAIHVVIATYAPEIDNDDHLRAVRLEVRVKPDGEVRAVIVSRESEFAER